RWVRLDSVNANALEPTALMLYRALPNQPVGGGKLLRFGLWGHRRDLLRFAVASLAITALGLLAPIATGTVLGVLVPNAERGLIVGMCAAVALASVVSAGLSMLKNLALLRVEGRGQAGMQAAVWDRLLRHPPTFFADVSTGELVGTALGVSQIQQKTIAF